jgi:eukaryotic-like serine/threonine-protein kinase
VELAPGTILLGKYRIDELIGTGGMGNVVRASHLYLQEAVAIKILLPQMAESESTVQRFLREAQAAVKLKSEHSARVMDVGTTPDGAPFMVMEYLEGNDLNQILRHHGPQLPQIAVDLMVQACEGIAEAHALGIIHRDIKPSNFFITRRPDGSMLLKILDFGISKSPIGYGELTGTQTVIGTPSYMAPEQMKSGRSADPRSDLWSIGVVLYQLLTGRTPFTGESYADLVLKVGLEPPAPLLVPLPPGLGEVVLRCLEKDPSQRFQNVGELARMLAPYASDPASAAQAASSAARTLEQRGLPASSHTSPFAGNGGRPVPAPLTPAQLTPHSWPRPHTAAGPASGGPSLAGASGPMGLSQGSSLSHGAGQVTQAPRGGRGLLIAGIASMCIIAGVGGYAISQVSRREASADPTRTEPHVVAPAPTPARQPTIADTAPAPSTTPPAPAPSTTPPAPTPPAATTAPAVAHDEPAANPSPWKATPAVPTIIGGDAPAKPADKPAEAAGDRPAGKLIDTAVPIPADASARKAADRPVHRATPPEPRAAPPAPTPTTDHAASKKPKPGKAKPGDDLFDSRK